MDGAVRWELTDIIGAEDGLGVECLSGSGAIASAYNKAFRWVHGDGHGQVRGLVRGARLRMQACCVQPRDSGWLLLLLLSSGDGGAPVADCWCCNPVNGIPYTLGPTLASRP